MTQIQSGLNVWLLILFIFSGALNETHAIEVQGHRGARSVLPENSLPAFEYALEIGVDTLELDTGVTKDGVVVVIHDQHINTSLCQYKTGEAVEAGQWVRQLTLAQIKEFDCGSLPNPRFKRQTRIPHTEIPTLDEVFRLVGNSGFANANTVLFNIETKSNPDNPQAQPSPKIFAQKVLALVEKHRLSDRTTLQSFDHRTLLAAHELNPNITLAALYHENLTDWVTPTLATKASIVSPKFNNLTADEVAQCQAAGLKVIPWTANRQQDWKTLIDMGVDGIITDDPEPLLMLLGKR